MRSLKIGIVKFGKKIYLKRRSFNERTSYNDEILGLSNVLCMDHDVKVLSNNDEESNAWMIEDWNQFDLIFVFNGLVQKNLIKKLNSYKGKICFVQSDLTLPWPTGCRSYDFLLNQNIASKDYGHIEKWYLIGRLENYFEPLDFWTREHDIVYIGNERTGDRNADFDRYLLNNPEAKVWGKFTSKKYLRAKNFLGKIKFWEGQFLLKKARFGLLITDKLYQRNNFLTQRYWEYVYNGCIVLIDHKVDRHQLYFDPHNDSRIVKNRKESLRIVKKCKESRSFRTRLYESQRRELLDSYLDGRFIRQMFWQKFDQWGFNGNRKR